MTDTNDPAARSQPADFADGLEPHDLLSPALRSDAESFPVLKAFQEYIEAERERARKRLMVVAASAIVAIALVVVFLLAIGAMMMGNLMKSNDKLQEAFITAMTRPDAQSAHRESAALSERERRAEEALKRLQEDNQRLQANVESLNALPGALSSALELTLSNLVAQTARQTQPAAAPAQPVKAAAVASPPASRSPFAPGARPGVGPVGTRGGAPATRQGGTTAQQQPAVAQGASVALTDGVAEMPAPAAEQAFAPPAPQVETAATVRPDDSHARSDTHLTSEPDVITISGKGATSPSIAGFTPAKMSLITEKGIMIPWRIVVPEE